jgi:NADH pyrophosphatase NudC (nudix superfamily)
MSRYIDAELLIEAMQGRKFANDECMRHGTDSSDKEYYRHLQFEDGIMMGFVREQPTADVKPVVHGHWFNSTTLSGEMVFGCSCCSFRWEHKYKFCPNCGAEMESEDGSN